VTSKERILAAFEHREADRVPIWESFWGSTMKRWKNEGLKEGTDLNNFFGLDRTHHTALDWTCQFPADMIEETEEYTISRTSNGAMQKSFKARDTTPLWWDYQLTDRASWEELKPRFLWNEQRIDINAAKAAWEANKDLFCIYFPACCGFEKFKYAMGMENILMAMAEDPEWTAVMFMATADCAVDGMEYLIGHGLQFDATFITEDMGFKGRGFFSPRAYRELIMPAHKKLCDAGHAHGMKMMLHTCGMNMELVPLYIEAGFEVLNPLEVKAGMDIFELKKNFGDVLTLWGGIDVRAVADPDPETLENEIREKVTMAKRGGGYVFSSDHSIPDNVSLKKYQWMLELAHKYGSF
jgi:uroporphyrinogen decarboxylase